MSPREKTPTHLYTVSKVFDSYCSLSSLWPLLVLFYAFSVHWSIKSEYTPVYENEQKRAQNTFTFHKLFSKILFSGEN